MRLARRVRRPGGARELKSDGKGHAHGVVQEPMCAKPALMLSGLAANEPALVLGEVRTVGERSGLVVPGALMVPLRTASWFALQKKVVVSTRATVRREFGGPLDPKQRTK
jgi:hypothetical protein